MRLAHAFAVGTALALSACGGGGSEAGGSDNSAADANHISEDPFGATGAPGADLTDNGATDGANGLADTNEGSPLGVLGDEADANGS